MTKIFTILLLLTGRKAFGKPWWHLLQNLETEEDTCNKRPCYHWRLIFSLHLLAFLILLMSGLHRYNVLRDIQMIQLEVRATIWSRERSWD